MSELGMHIATLVASILMKYSLSREEKRIFGLVYKKADLNSVVSQISL